MNNKFLLATDYSNEVMNAERYAVQIAKETNSTLALLHVYPIPITFPSEVIEYAKSIEELRQSEMKRLEQHRDELFRALNINPEKLPCECIVREGSAGGQICKEAEESHADFIIVGTHGASGFREAFLGSHSWDVIRKASVPVFAIPKDALFTGIQNIVFGTAYREDDLSALEFLTHFAKEFNAELTILHVTNYMLSKKFEKEMFEKFRSDVKEQFPYSKLEVRLLVNDAIAEGLNLYCSDNKTDLLAMSVPKTSLFEKIFLPALSMTRKMVFHTHIPLLAIPDSYHVEHSEKFVYSDDVGLLD